jgi:peptidoglycan/LPS O-acetylase OafA/YrhL
MCRHLLETSNGLAGQVERFIIGGGGVAVDLFFVLSGFLISGLMFREYETSGTFNPGRFLIRRGFKIYPVFYLFLAMTLALLYFRHVVDAETRLKYLYEALFICNYTWLPPQHDWLWTICVEEHFYLFFCILMVILVRYRKVSFKTFLFVYLFLLLFGLVVRSYNIMSSHPLFWDIGRISHARFDSMFFGVLVSYMYRHNALVKWRSPAMTCIAIVGLLLPFLFPLDDIRYIVLNKVVFLATDPVCCGYLIIRILQVRGAWMRPLAYIGKYSYSIYLFHGFVNAFVHGHLSGWKYIIAYFLGSLAVGIAVSKIVEYPALALRDRFFPAIAGNLQTRGTLIKE